MTEAHPTTPDIKLFRVGVVTTQDVVAAGLRSIFETELGPGVLTPVGPADGEPDREPDVVLYDVIALHEGDGADLDHWVKETGSTVIALVRDLRPDLGAQALGRGAEAAVAIGASAAELVGVVRAAIAGTLDESAPARHARSARRLGREAGLSRRETEVLRMIAAGVTNQVIAETLFLSINSVKTYIRTTYRKIGVSNRAQAVAWAIGHGYPPTLPSPDASHDAGHDAGKVG